MHSTSLKTAWKMSEHSFATTPNHSHFYTSLCIHHVRRQTPYRRFRARPQSPPASPAPMSEPRKPVAVVLTNGMQPFLYKFRTISYGTAPDCAAVLVQSYRPMRACSRSLSPRTLVCIVVQQLVQRRSCVSFFRLVLLSRVFPIHLCNFCPVLRMQYMSPFSVLYPTPLTEFTLVANLQQLTTMHALQKYANTAIRWKFTNKWVGNQRTRSNKTFILQSALLPLYQVPSSPASPQSLSLRAP